MKLKPVLLAATLALGASAATAFAAKEPYADAPARGTPVSAPLLNSDPSAAKAGKSKAEKPVNRDGHTEEKTTTPKVMQLRDWEELFGHKPMEEETNMPMPEPASGASKQETMKPMKKHDHMKEKH